MTGTHADSTLQEESAGTAAVHPILENDHASEWMGIEVLRVADGHATITMTLRREMLNGFGIAHGGMVFAFADTAFALACNPHTGSEDTITVASGVDINFLKPGIPGRTLTAVADRRAAAGRSGIYDISILQSVPGGDDELIAEFRGRSRTVPKR
ncbi:hydroxyphenylacetyl-CoA thioesterase PaaI [Zafaria sp. Z1313]|uniref:hydroxyphenylacetyl-CoA thioesterase PaaI n=1 Tax=unclassified Zafaria TaxID=2828765 RepID=UPI002E7680C5|nr:hydroxyphenylacetyl-CoA thioesterase PaaI [Zafaria sp. J156]MEE1621283.1 hydroxyphenylacetyl-CoA thioesterase PaaI [Zafaria sp. J156]